MHKLYPTYDEIVQSIAKHLSLYKNQKGGFPKDQTKNQAKNSNLNSSIAVMIYYYATQLLQLDESGYHSQVLRNTIEFLLTHQSFLFQIHGGILMEWDVPDLKAMAIRFLNLMGSSFGCKIKKIGIPLKQYYTIIAYFGQIIYF